ncbi:MAG: diphthamide synthesis protein [Candidatus Altiarchaeota archaeon]
MKVLHIPCHSKADPLFALKENVKRLKSYSNVGLMASAQHLNQLDKIRDFLVGEGISASIGEQILGCQIKPDMIDCGSEPDCYVYIGSGRFHPLGLALKTDKPVFILNPLSNVFDEVSNEEKEKWFKRKKGRLTVAAAAETFGILVCTKSGQFDLNKAKNLKVDLEKKNKKAYIFAGAEITPDNLLPFKVDAWINTGCPRIVDDEHEKPIVNAEELKEIFS